MQLHNHLYVNVASIVHGVLKICVHILDIFLHKQLELISGSTPCIADLP